MATLTPKQKEMLLDIDRDNEATDIYAYDGAGHLGWLNRGRVINALERKGLINGDGLTDAGRQLADLYRA